MFRKEWQHLFQYWVIVFRTAKRIIRLVRSPFGFIDNKRHGLRKCTTLAWIVIWWNHWTWFEPSFLARVWGHQRERKWTRSNECITMHRMLSGRMQLLHRESYSSRASCLKRVERTKRSLKMKLSSALKRKIMVERSCHANKVDIQEREKRRWGSV